MSDPLAAAGALVLVLWMMLAEAARSKRHETVLRRRGAVEPVHDVYRTMRWAYPACFVAMAVEGALRGTGSTALWAAGSAIFAFAKALKYWAIVTLGERWTFRVLVLPGLPVVQSGPYRYLRHPNYIAVLGELAGMALALAARFSGPVALCSFGAIVARRIRTEEEALAQVAPEDRQEC